MCPQRRLRSVGDKDGYTAYTLSHGSHHEPNTTQRHRHTSCDMYPDDNINRQSLQVSLFDISRRGSRPRTVDLATDEVPYLSPMSKLGTLMGPSGGLNDVTTR